MTIAARQTYESKNIGIVFWKNDSRKRLTCWRSSADSVMQAMLLNGRITCFALTWNVA
jgi:hypothetical protein